MNLAVIKYRLLGYKTIDELMKEMEMGFRSEVNEKEIDNAKKLKVLFCQKI